MGQNQNQQHKSVNGSKIAKPTKKIPEANGCVQTKLQSNLSVQLRLGKGTNSRGG